MAGTEKSILNLTKPLLFLSNFSIFLLFFLFFFSFALFAAATPHHALLNLDNINNNIIKLKPQTDNALFYHQVLMKMDEEWVSSFSMPQQGRWRWSLRRRLLSSDQPGSWPPLCISKCDQCTPCQPVHVSVPPGTPVTTEYYPVAWRCKCGNKLYMP